MQPDAFERPVKVLTGLGVPTRIETVLQAYRLLMEWPSLRRHPAHEIAVNACQAALMGEVEPETVRGLFVAFAERHDLLASDITGVIAAGGGSWDPHIS